MATKPRRSQDKGKLAATRTHCTLRAAEKQRYCTTCAPTSDYSRDGGTLDTISRIRSCSCCRFSLVATTFVLPVECAYCCVQGITPSTKQGATTPFPSPLFRRNAGNTQNHTTKYSKYETTPAVVGEWVSKRKSWESTWKLGDELLAH